MKSKWKLIWGGLGLILILTFTLINLNRGLETELLAVQPTTIANTFKEEGTVVPQIEQPIYPLNSAQIIELPVKEGQEVKAGDVLAVLDTAELQYQLEQLQGQLLSLQGERTQTVKELEGEIRQLELDLADYETNLKRTEELYKADAVTKKELEDRQKLVEKTKISLNQKKETLQLLKQSSASSGGTNQYYAGKAAAINAQIAQLEYQINQSTITAPINGVVANLNCKTGEPANMSEPLMTIVQKNVYQVETFVLTEDAASLREGMSVSLILRGNDKEDITFSGKIKEISPTATERLSALGVEEQRVKVVIDFSPPKGVTLIPGAKLDVEFTTEKRANQLVVPKTALFPYKDGTAIWVVRRGKAHLQPVVTGFQTKQETAIKEGLKPGDLVILNPRLEGLKEGKKVKHRDGSATL